MDPPQDQWRDGGSLQPSLPTMHYGSSLTTASRRMLNHTFSFYNSLLLPSSSAYSHLLPSSLLSSSSPRPPSPLSTSLASSRAFDPLLHQPPPSLHPSPASPYGLSPSLFPPGELEDLGRTLIWTLHEPGTIALTVMYCVSFIVGFVGNLMSLRVLTNPRSRRLAGVSATRVLLVNLAVCDLAVVCICMPVTLGSRIYTVWVYGDFMCRAVPFTQAVSVSASVLTLTVISVNRYYSVRSPLRARSIFTRRRILATVAVVWVVSSVMCAPLAVMNRRREFNFGNFAILVCQEEWPHLRLKQGYNVVLFVVLYCLPVTFNLTIGFLTGRRLWGGRKSTFSDLDPRSQALHASCLKTRQKIAKMVVCLVLLFAVSWLPLYLADLWIDQEQVPPSWLLQTRPFAQWLGLTNSSLNPICYCFIGDLYRSAKVIRTRYYQKVAALFSSSSFSNSAAMATAVTTITNTEASVSDHPHIAAATVMASASMVTVPGLLSLAQGSGFVLGHRIGRKIAEGGGGSDHSFSDLFKSSPSVYDSSLLSGQLPSFRFSTPASELLPPRRHSVNDRTTLPLRGEATVKDTLPSRRHSGDRLYTLSASVGDTIDQVSVSLGEQCGNNTSHTLSIEEDNEHETADITSL